MKRIWYEAGWLAATVVMMVFCWIFAGIAFWQHRMVSGVVDLACSAVHVGCIVWRSIRLRHMWIYWMVVKDGMPKVR